jgi:hypothetical protein
MAIQQSTAHPSENSLSLCVLWFFVACSGFVLYTLTVQQSVSWQDSGMLQFRIVTGDYIGNLGLALAHPVYIAIARFFLLLPFGSEWLSLSICSGAGMAVTLANVAVLGILLTGRRWIGLMTAGMLAVMHAPWWLSTVTEVYTWNTALFSAELIVCIACLRRPSLYKVAALFFIAGLNVGVHNMALLSLPVYGLCVLVFVRRHRLAFTAVPIAAAACLCGAAPLVWLVLQETLQTGDFRAAVASMLFSGYSGQVFNVSPNWNWMGVNAALSSLNFMHAGLFVGIVGWVQMRRTIGTPIALSLLSLLGLQGIFFLRYSVPDQFTFILPSLVLFSLGMAVGMEVLARKSTAWRNTVVAVCLFSVILMPLTYAVLPSALEALNLRASRARTLPFRDEMRYWIVPWKHTEKSAERFARAALNEAAPDGIIVCDSTSYYPLILMQGRLQSTEGVSIEDHNSMVGRYGADPGALSQLLREHPVFVVSPVLNFLSEQCRQDFELRKEPDRILYRLRMQDQGTAL